MSDSKIDEPDFIKISNIKIHIFSLEQLLQKIIKTIQIREKKLIFYANIHAINLAYVNPQFNVALNSANVIFCDGVGLKLGAYLLGLKTPPRYTPPDWIYHLCQVCVEHNWTMFFLGAKPGVTNKAVIHLKEKFPDLQIAGVHHGYFNKTHNSLDNTKMIQTINSTKPNILLVGFGMPLQETWLVENWSHIDVNIAITVGGLFDYISKDIYRAPRWITDNGFEWLARLIIEPRRLWKRYLIGNPLFFYRILKERFNHQPKSDSKSDCE